MNRVSDIVDFNKVLRHLNEENVQSTLALLIGREINICNILCVGGKTFLSHFCNKSIAHALVTEEWFCRSRIHFSFHILNSPTDWDDISLLENETRKPFATEILLSASTFWPLGVLKKKKLDGKKWSIQLQ